MILLAIDCSANLCAASVYDTAVGRELGRSVLDLGKGHAEHLMAVIGDALQQAGKAYADLDRIAVSIGPGSFTGVRVGVSAARGLALALKVPAVGVTTLEALAAEARESLGARTVLAALDAGRGEIHAALYDPVGQTMIAPMATDLAEATRLALEQGAALAGTAAPSIAALTGLPVGPASATADIAFYARLGAAKAASPGQRKPAPLYLRAPDAKPQASFVVARAER